MSAKSPSLGRCESSISVGNWIFPAVTFSVVLYRSLSSFHHRLVGTLHEYCTYILHIYYIPQALPLCETTYLEITSPFESCRTLKSRHGALRHHRIALCVLYRLCFPLRPSAHRRVVAYLFVSLPLSLYKYLTFNFPALPLHTSKRKEPVPFLCFYLCSLLATYLLLQHSRTRTLLD